jgi:hypothetical protein
VICATNWATTSDGEGTDHTVERTEMMDELSGNLGEVK